MSQCADNNIKILVYSPAFHPGVGGLEAVVAMVAAGLARLGCSVRVVTTTPGRGDDGQFPYEVVRSPSASALVGLVRWCDVFFQQNVSLKGLWPLLLCRRRLVVAHHGLYARGDGRRGWQARLKYLVARFAVNIAVSSFVARELGTECAVIPNPYREDLFRLLPGIARDRDLVFVGRLVSEKGADVLVAALALLRQRGLTPGLTIVGAGPEEAALRQQVAQAGCAGQVVFAGGKSPEELPELLNRHRLLVVPSLVREGFGIVALEGIACGCLVLASGHGGLPEAVGSCGVLFPAGDAAALADAIGGLLAEPAGMELMRQSAAAHLAGHSRERVAADYLAALKNMTGIK